MPSQTIPSRPRRRDREITDFAVIADILRGNHTAAVSLVDGDRPYGVMLNYAPVIRDDDHTIRLIFHCATAGRKLDCIRRNPAASIFVNDARAERIDLQGDRPSGNSTTRYRSVILQGSIRLADDLAERRRLAETFLRHYAPADVPVDLPPDAALAATQFLVFTAEAVSGKQNLP